MNELGKLSGAGGCQPITTAGIYAVSAGTLIPGVTSIYVITGAAAAITALSIKPEGKTAVPLPAVNNIVNLDLTDFAGGPPLTFIHPVSTLTVAAGVKLIAYAG
jgi:hypothetical protein